VGPRSLTAALEDGVWLGKSSEEVGLEDPERIREGVGVTGSDAAISLLASGRIKGGYGNGLY
jgi:hypothetical protein